MDLQHLIPVKCFYRKRLGSSLQVRSVLPTVSYDKTHIMWFWLRGEKWEKKAGFRPISGCDTGQPAGTPLSCIKWELFYFCKLYIINASFIYPTARLLHLCFQCFPFVTDRSDQIKFMSYADNMLYCNLLLKHSSHIKNTNNILRKRNFVTSCRFPFSCPKHRWWVLCRNQNK